MESVIAIIGDTHIGSSTAIAPPKFSIHTDNELETQVVNHNSIQKWSWSCWLDSFEYMKQLVYQGKKRKQKRLIIVLMGDMMDGNHHGTHQIIQDVGDQMLVAKDVLAPWVDAADYAYGILGTETHAGGEEIALYKDFGLDYGATVMLDVDGVIHDFAHHGRVGGRPWTSQAVSIANEVIIDCALQGIQLPNYIWRAHSHKIDDSGNKIEGVRAIGIPSWQLKTRFAYRIPSAVNMRSDIGMYFVDSGKVDETKSRYHGEIANRRIIKV